MCKIGSITWAAKVVQCNFVVSLEIWSGLNFINILWKAFTHKDSECVKKDCRVVNLFYAFGIYNHKSCWYNFDEIWHQKYIAVIARNQKQTHSTNLNYKFQLILGLDFEVCPSEISKNKSNKTEEIFYVIQMTNNFIILLLM